MDAGQRANLRQVHPQDSGVGVRAAQEGGVQHLRPLEIGQEAPLPPQQARVLDPLDAGAEQTGRDRDTQDVTGVRFCNTTFRSAPGLKM